MAVVTKKTNAKNFRKSVLTPKKALAAAKAAKKAFAKKTGAPSAAWKEGGREWSRVLGHFGPRTASSRR